MINVTRILPMNIPVSVVMPSLNQAQFLEIAIRSVLEQDYPNVELIVVDGHSSDGTLNLLSALQCEYGERLKWISERDNGAAEALNKAIALVNGDIVGWLNSDDMYLQGAIKAAVSYFEGHANHHMVYGLGNHVDVTGKIIGPYPTKPPSTNIDIFSNGSFICQPTVFMRTKALRSIGPLDPNLKLAFDFDLFLRLFKRYPRQIGIIRRIQAYSRLHSACMTQRLRRNVALEAMHVIKKELGVVPDHWFWTHIDEICESHPFGINPLPLLVQVEPFLKESQKFFQPDVFKKFLPSLKADWRFRLATPNLYASVYPDGWVSKRVLVKYRWDENPARAVLVRCNALWPVSGKLRLKVFLPSGLEQFMTVEVPSDFMFRLEIPQVNTSGSMIWVISTSQVFIPSKYDKKSTDNRKLSFQVLKLEEEN